MAGCLDLVQTNGVAFEHLLDKATPIPCQRAWVRKKGFTCGDRGTFGIPIYRVLVLYRSLFTEYVVVQVEDIVLAFSLNLVSFPSLPAVEVRKMSIKSQKHVIITYNSTLRDLCVS